MVYIELLYQFIISSEADLSSTSVPLSSVIVFCRTNTIFDLCCLPFYIIYVCVCVSSFHLVVRGFHYGGSFPRRDQVKWGSGCQQTVQTGRRADRFSVFVFLSEFNQRIIQLKHRWSCFVPLFSQDGMKYWYDVSHHFLLWYDYRYTDAKYRYFYQTVEPLWLLWRF